MTLSPEYLEGAKALLRGLMLPICPKCGGYIAPDDNTGRMNPDGALFHAECIEQIHHEETR